MTVRNETTLPPFGLTGWAAADIADPYPVYRRYREAAPMHRAPDGTHYVFGYDAVTAVLASRDFGRRAHPAEGEPRPLVPNRFAALRTMVENWLVFMDPPRHIALRSVLGREFSPSVVSDLRGRITEIGAALLADIPDATEFDFVRAFAAPLPILVIGELLGVPAERWDWLRERAVAIQGASSSRVGGRADTLVAADAAAHDLRDYFLSVAAQRRTAPRADLISLLLRCEGLTDDEFAATCVHLMTAGHETTTNALGKAVLTLAARPEAAARLRAMPRLHASAVDELIRFDGPVQAVTRWAQHDLLLAEERIPQGAKLIAMLGAANRDPARFPDPDAFLLSRPTAGHVGFGRGIHYCLGATLARTELEIGLGLLLPILDRFTVAAVEYPHDMVFHGPELLRLRRA
ncbi:cytochrome P450 [Nocardia crassostreae]|uniref:cytochrome P450 n=1 Tax=Nocardia crassostreae TaxID=53428 RepID=UPI000A073EE0|nr:cytochrome P450 [Nocardia crassostreae]